MFEFKADLRELLSKYGANEVLTYSFVSDRLLAKCGLDSANSYKIVNSISPELQYIRQSLVPILLDKAYINQKTPIDKFAIFEINDIYQRQNGLDGDGVPVEKTSLALVLAERKNKGTAFYKAKKYLDKVLSVYHLDVKYVPLAVDAPEAVPFEKKRAAEVVVNGEILGVVGEFKNSVRNEFKLEPYLAGFEIDLKMLASLADDKKKIVLREVVSEDVTVTTEKTYDEVVEEVSGRFQNITKVLPLSIYQADGQKTRNVSVRVFYEKS
jgi:phenylalanyl-tRNA synthetase beta chain